MIDADDGIWRYKIGVIDFLTKYSTVKLIENQVKSKLARVDRMSISAIDQVSYKTRFDHFMQKYI